MKKTILIVLLSIIALVCMGYVGLNGFAKMIYDERSCEWANIDHLELHARIDIPAIINSDCSFDSDVKTKIATFDLDLKKLDLKNYLVQNQFKKLTDPTLLNTDYLKKFTSSNNSLYYKKTSTDVSSSEVLLDTKTGKLHLVIRYHT